MLGLTAVVSLVDSYDPDPELIAGVAATAHQFLGPGPTFVRVTKLLGSNMFLQIKVAGFATTIEQFGRYPTTTSLLQSRVCILLFLLS